MPVQKAYLPRVLKMPHTTQLQGTGITLRYTEQVWFCFQGTVSYTAFEV